MLSGATSRLDLLPQLVIVGLLLLGDDLFLSRSLWQVGQILQVALVSNLAVGLGGGSPTGLAGELDHLSEVAVHSRLVHWNINNLTTRGEKYVKKLFETRRYFQELRICRAHFKIALPTIAERSFHFDQSFDVLLQLKLENLIHVTGALLVMLLLQLNSIRKGKRKTSKKSTNWLLHV